MQKSIDVASDFSGVGAFEQSLKRIGINYNKKFACDFNKYARQSYIITQGNENDKKIVFSKEHSQLCKILEKGEELTDEILIRMDQMAKSFSFYYPFSVYNREIPEKSVDIYATSPPCQAFSLAGKREGKEDHRGILFFNSLEFIKINKPRVFIFENVKGLLSHDKVNKKAVYGRTFQEWINFLGGKSVNGNLTIMPYEYSVPYHIYHYVMNAKEHGVPQNRERVFIIGFRDDADNDFSFPKPFKLEKRLRHVLESEVDEKYFLSDTLLEYFEKHLIEHKEKGNGFGFKPKDLDAECANSITTKYGTRQSDTFLKMGAIRGRNPDNPKSRKKGIELQQILEINETDLCNTITTVQKDNVVVEFQLTGGKWDKTHEQSGRVYDKDGISPTIHTMQGGNQEPKIFHEPDSLIIQANNKKGFDEVKANEDSINFSHLNSSTKRGRVGKEICQTIDTSATQGIYTKKRIRKLTPKECFRLMGFEDKDFIDIINQHNIENPKKTMSDSQLYKQAGNSIVVDCYVENLKKIKWIH